MNNSVKHNKEESDEIRIPMPWGDIVGRWYGNRQARPILAIHGWLDNMGTWNTLVPLLPKYVGILEIELPGHGKSTPLPKGINYHVLYYLTIIVKIMNIYDWQKVSILSHSMGSIISFVFASLYPERLDLLIHIDIVQPTYREPATRLRQMNTYVEKLLVENERYGKENEKEPPSYSYEQLSKLLYDQQSVALENTGHILDRNIKKSSLYPEKYYFSRDGRIKFIFEINFNLELMADMAKRITDVPFCVIKASRSNFINKYSVKIIEILKGVNPYFEFHIVEGTHHVHLNNPVECAAIINQFIYKYRPPPVGSWTVSDEDLDDRNKSKL